MRLKIAALMLRENEIQCVNDKKNVACPGPTSWSFWSSSVGVSPCSSQQVDGHYLPVLAMNIRRKRSGAENRASRSDGASSSRTHFEAMCNGMFARTLSVAGCSFFRQIEGENEASHTEPPEEVVEAPVVCREITPVLLLRRLHHEPELHAMLHGIQQLLGSDEHI